MTAVLDARGARMKGDLRIWPLVDVVLWLHRCGHTAHVRIVVGGDVGAILLEDGEVIAAQFEDDVGETALHRLLEINSGAFMVMPVAAEEVATRNVFASTGQWFLERALHRDERNRRGAA